MTFSRLKKPLGTIQIWLRERSQYWGEISFQAASESQQKRKVDLAGAEDMYIRDIARHLYQLQRRLEELERDYEEELDVDKRDELERELHRLRAEHQKVKNILEGAKES